MDSILLIGIGAGILTAVSMIPQLLKMLKEKKADDVSPIMLITLIVGVSFWIVYGVLKKDIPIIATNSFSVLLNLALIFLRYKYSH